MYRVNTRKNIIVIGGNAAGPAAAAKAKRTDPEAEVLMIEAGEFISTGTCELPYLLSGEITKYEDIVFYNPQSFENEKGVKVLTLHLAEKIDRFRKVISLKNLITGHIFEQEYDKLILCTGSNAKFIEALPKNLSNLFTLKSVSDLIFIQSYLKKNVVRDILIIGAGYISLEVADGLKKLGYNITLLEKEKLPMPGVEEEVRHLIAGLIKQNGVEFYGDTQKIKFNNDGQKLQSIKIDGRVLNYDMAIQGVGFEPNNLLALSSKLNVGKSGGIKVDQKLRTSDPNIFAAGDCIEVINRITNKPAFIPLATFAHQSGHTAGENAAGGNSVFQSVIKNIAVKFFGKSLVSVGLSSAEARESGLNFISVHTIVPNLVKVMPQSEPVFGKIIFDKNTKLILGANFLGGIETIGYGDLISSFIQNKIKASELSKINFNYTPPLSPFINILSVLGRKIERELR